MTPSRRALFGLLGAAAAAPMLPRAAAATAFRPYRAATAGQYGGDVVAPLDHTTRYDHVTYALGYAITGRNAAGRRVHERILHDPGAGDFIDLGGWT
jgi:hypothetical protein